MNFTDQPAVPTAPADALPALPPAVLCHPRAHRLMREAVGRLESVQGLLAGAVAIAAHDNDAATYEDVDRRLAAIAGEVRGRVRGRQVQALLAHLHAHLFDDLGFCGDARDYYNPLNSDISAVLRRRKGLPILLSLVYADVARRLGLRVRGVALPGHFVVSVEADGGEMLVDPFFNGVVLAEDEARERVRAVLGRDEPWEARHTEPVTNRHWLTRIVQNLLGAQGAAGRFADVAAMLELEMLLWPDQTHLQRDLGLCLARAGHTSEAGRCLERYLADHPDDPQADDLTDLLTALR